MGRQLWCLDLQQPFKMSLGNKNFSEKLQQPTAKYLFPLFIFHDSPGFFIAASWIWILSSSTRQGGSGRHTEISFQCLSNHFQAPSSCIQMRVWKQAPTTIGKDGHPHQTPSLPCLLLPFLIFPIWLLLHTFMDMMVILPGSLWLGNPFPFSTNVLQCCSVVWWGYSLTV